MEIIHMEVGKRFPIQEILDKVCGGEGGASLDYNSNEKTLSLYVSIPNPTKSEINAFRKDLIRFALYPNHILNTSIIMVYLGMELVFDLIYDINVLDINVDGKVEGNRFDLYLIDSETGILKGMRTLGLGKNFMSKLNRITANDGRYTTNEYNEWLKNDVYRKSLQQLWADSERVDWDN